MKKIQTFFLTMGVVSTFVVYAHPATYDLNSKQLHIPDVEVSIDDTSRPDVYEVDMQRTDNILKFEFEITNATPLGKDGPFLRGIKKRGSVLCGGRTDLPGFGYYCPDGRHCGFDIDLCRAVAAAAFNSPTGPITFVPVPTAEKEEILRKGDVDILSRNTTWTSSRDAKWGNFTWIMFYDGQSFMVREDSGITEVTHLNGKNICVIRETTTYTHLVDYFARLGLEFTPILASETSELMPLYLRGECDAVTTDRSGLAARRAGFDDKASHKILDDVISKEPLTPIVPRRDDQWFDLVKIVMFALINAEELNITKDNVDAMMNSDDPEVKRLLGVEGSFGQEELGLEKGAIAQAIRAVGNYGEIYDRHFGPNGIDIPRENSLNELWINGGLIYAPPMR